jgi:hypothetical protein
MAAMAGASGVRAWMQNRGWTWLTPKRLKRVTVGLFVAGTLLSTVGLSGSTKAQQHHTPPPSAAQQADLAR